MTPRTSTEGRDPHAGRSRPMAASTKNPAAAIRFVIDTAVYRVSTDTLCFRKVQRLMFQDVLDIGAGGAGGAAGATGAEGVAGVVAVSILMSPFTVVMRSS